MCVSCFVLTFLLVVAAALVTLASCCQQFNCKFRQYLPQAFADAQAISKIFNPLAYVVRERPQIFTNTISLKRDSKRVVYWEKKL